MSKILLDTNVLIYAVDEESSFYPASRALLDSEHELFTSCKNISEFLAVLTRAPITSISLEDALATVDDFRTIMTILYPNDASFEKFRAILRQYRFTGLKIHDAEIASIGLAHQITKIATFNRSDFEDIQEITLITPEKPAESLSSCDTREQ